MPRESSTKIIERNRTPRVHIAYDVDVNGKMVKTELPFVMGVMADLAGKSLSDEAQKDLAQRKFLNFDVHTFDERMEALEPRVAFQAPNRITGEGNITVDLTFKKMDDFSPERIAEEVEGLRDLVESRKQLDALRNITQGKAATERLLNETLASAREGNRTLLEALATHRDTSADNQSLNGQ